MAFTIVLCLMVGLSALVFALAAARAAATDPAAAHAARRRRQFAAGRFHSSHEGDAMEHGHPDCAGFWSMVVDLGHGPKWIVCHRCQQYHLATEARLVEARRQNNFALDVMDEAARGADLLSAERMEGAA